MTNYIGWEGLGDWQSSARGNEKIGVGIRPHGFHAGNLAAVVAVPYLVCEQKKLATGDEPCFTLTVWMNDPEPVEYVGHNGSAESADAANMYPGSTTFQHMPAPKGFGGSLTAYWQPVIEGVVRGVIGTAFPKVKLEFHRASELVTTPQFKDAMRICMQPNQNVARIIRDNTDIPVRGDFKFAWPLCPTCHSPLTTVKLNQDDRITVSHEIGGDKHGDFTLEIEECSWAA